MAPAIPPETPLEKQLLADPRLQAGLEWGASRPGHPEGRVAHHVAAMLAQIGPGDPLRADLRFLAIVHDSFKAEVDPDLPWSPANDHAVLARRFAERYTADERLLAALELHDEPYWLWRTAADPNAGLRQVLDRLPDPELFARFVELDAANEGKDLTFLWWFRRELALTGRFAAQRGHAPGDPVETGGTMVYVKAFATDARQQHAVAQAAARVVAEHESVMGARGEVLASDDGMRVWMIWRWHGSRTELIERDAEAVRRAIAADPVFADVRLLEARLMRPIDPPQDPEPDATGRATGG